MSRTIALACGIVLVLSVGCQHREVVDVAPLKAMEHDQKSCEICDAFAPVRLALTSMTIEELMGKLPVVDVLPIDEPVEELTMRGVNLRITGCAACGGIRSGAIAADLPTFRLFSVDHDEYWIEMSEGWTGFISYHGPFRIDDRGRLHVSAR